MNILYLGDIMGELGVQVVERLLPEIKQEHQVDLVIAQAENVTAGKGMSLNDYKQLRSIGIDVFTGGNWSNHLTELDKVLDDPKEPVIRPANYPDDVPGKGAKVIQTPSGSVLVVSLLGQIVGKDADKPVDNPLKVVDSILQDNKHVKHRAIVVNFHGDYSSEKFVIGRYLDGRVTAVIGDHWHVPSADAMVLPGGTAHITDVGMCGSLDSCLGVKLDVIIPRWRDGKTSRNILEDSGRLQLNAVLIKTRPDGLSESIAPIRQIIE